MSKNKGITLIALVVTIIIMLILVGVAINQLGGDNGIIVKARWSEFVTEYERVDEAKELYGAGKLIDKYDKQAKFTLKSLFTNISHAEEQTEMLYPVDLNKRFYMSEALPTLKNTICEVESLKEYDLFDIEKVNLYRVDFGLLDDIEVKREYIINIVTGMLYYIDGEPYRDRIYHTLRYGAPKELNKPNEDITDLENPEPELKIHYLSGYDGAEYTQTVKESNSYSVTLNPVEFKKTNYHFLYWKDITDEKISNNEDDEEQPIIDFTYQTGGYYDVANQLISILDQMWETDILEIIEENANYEPDPDDDEAAPNAATQIKNEILDYLSVYQTEIQEILGSGQNMSGLISWFVNNTDYLRKLEEYESEYWTDEEEEPDEEETEMDYDTYEDQEQNVNMGAQDMWLEAIWTEGFITLDGNGGKIRGKDTTIVGVQEGKQYGTALSITPTRENYVFAGWFTETTGGVQKVKTDIFSAADLPNRILYAQWEETTSPNIVTLTYDANGGTMKDSKNKKVKTLTENRVKGTKINSFPAVQPEMEKKNWFFAGWFTEPEGGTKVDESTVINESMTVYARWTCDANVKIVLNGGELFTRYTKPEKIEERYNQWFPVKYYDGVDTSRVYAEDGKKIPKQAKGRQLPFNYGWRGMKKERIVKTPQGRDYKVKSIFKGWYTGPEGTGILVEKQGKRNLYYVSYGDTLYANWREKYIIKYDTNQGHFGTNESNTWKQKYVFQDKRYPSMTKPKRAGYRFLGWYDSSEGGNKIELVNAAYIVKGDITLYAHWEKVQFDLKISNITETGWMQKIIPRSDLSGYSIRYQYSTSPKGNTIPTTTSNTVVINRKEGTTYYVWAYVMRYGDKIYSDVKEVTTLEQKLEFRVNVNVTSTNYTGWTQNITVTSGNVDGYTVRYCVSDSSQNDTSPHKTGTTQTARREGTTYYVWAEATKSGKTFKSTNYAVVKTGHAHTGTPTRIGGCYGGSYSTCTGSGNYIFGQVSGGSIRNNKLTIVNRKCASGHTMSKGIYYYIINDNRLVCLDCGGTYGGISSIWICDDCFNNKYNKTYTAPDGAIYIHCAAVDRICNNSGATTYIASSKVNHNKTYQLKCGKSEENTTCNFYNYPK